MQDKFDPFGRSAELLPTILTIFGATGNLSADYLLPALLHMDRESLLPKDFRLVCIGRRDFTKEGFLDYILEKSEVLNKDMAAGQKQHFLKQLTYFQGDFADPQSFAPLAEVLEDQEKPEHKCFNRLYYFATSPQYFAEITKILKQYGLLTSCESHNRKIRILVEKPFGFNLKSAQALNQLLLKYFNEDQIYRIDHYQGKETVQNLMVVRFANRLFEPLWNKEYIDHVEISVLENEVVGNRANFYDQAGAIKDFVQNHMLQMLSLIAMGEPYNLTADLIRDEKLRILKALRPFDGSSVSGNLVRGQYEGYQKEIGRESQTETFVAFKAFVNLPRWEGVPFYLRTGKALPKKVTEISVHFKELARCLFRNCAANVLTFRIQPNESVHLRLNNKIPGFGVILHQADLDFAYSKAFAGEIPPAYERLLLDFMEGDQRLFIRSDEIEAAWKFVDSITDNWNEHNAPLYKYQPGSEGPAEADELVKKDLKEWWTK
jgi:glucose-6-phosphate 1-dehydrogenase